MAVRDYAMEDLKQQGMTHYYINEQNMIMVIALEKCDNCNEMVELPNGWQLVEPEARIAAAGFIKLEKRPPEVLGHDEELGHTVCEVCG